MAKAKATRLVMPDRADHGMIVYLKLMTIGSSTSDVNAKRPKKNDGVDGVLVRPAIL